MLNVCFSRNRLWQQAGQTVFLEQQALEFSKSSSSHRSTSAWLGALLPEIPQDRLLRREDLSFWAPVCCCFILLVMGACVCSMELCSNLTMVWCFGRLRKVCSMTVCPVFVLPLVSEDMVYWAGLLSNVNTSELKGGCGFCYMVESEVGKEMLSSWQRLAEELNLRKLNFHLNL